MLPVLPLMLLATTTSHPLMMDDPVTTQVMPCNQADCRSVQLTYPLYYLAGNRIDAIAKQLRHYTIQLPHKPKRISGFIRGNDTMIGLNFRWHEVEQTYRIANSTRVATQIHQALSQRDHVLMKVTIKSNHADNHQITVNWFDSHTIKLNP